VSGFAANKTSNANYNIDINVNKLSAYLELSASQVEEVANISSYFSDKMYSASRAKKGQQKKLHEAVYGNLKLMKNTLTPEQYAKYLKLINVTVKNKGLDVEF
ncbi:MAG: hypothetical protein LUD15_06205, partial [Bacteroides sp.]|nr:hypothetical protein [Bacteroides sp.]